MYLKIKDASKKGRFTVNIIADNSEPLHNTEVLNSDEAVQTNIASLNKGITDLMVDRFYDLYGNAETTPNLSFAEMVTFMRSFEFPVKDERKLKNNRG